MNLLFFSDVSIQNVIGGAERVLFEQSTRLAAKGHSVHLITRRLPEHRAVRETIRGVEEIRCTFEAEGGLPSIRQTWRQARQHLVRLHAQSAVDCLNIHQPTTAFGALHAAVERQIPLVYTCHSLAFEEYLSRHPVSALTRQPLRRLNAMARCWVERRVLRHCRRVVALSHYTVEKLRHAYAISPGRMEVIPGGVDLATFHPAPDKAALRRRMGLPVDAFVLLTVRNLEPRMGLDKLIEAMPTVVGQIPDSYLVIGGEGPLKSRLIAQVKQRALSGRVGFTGFIPERELAAYYQMADLFILPSQELEGFGMVTLEALACGLPVLGTPIGGTQEILGGFDPAALLRGCGVTDIAEGILAHHERVSAAPERAHRLSRDCRRFVEARYAWDRNIEALETLLDSARTGRRAIPRPRGTAAGVA